MKNANLNMNPVKEVLETLKEREEHIRKMRERIDQELSPDDFSIEKSKTGFTS